MSLLPSARLSAEVRSTLASLQCSTRAVSASRVTADDVTRLTTVVADLESELLRLSGRVQSTRSNLRRRAGQLRRRLRFHAVSALGGVRRTFDGGLAKPFDEVRERSLALSVPLGEIPGGSSDRQRTG